MPDTRQGREDQADGEERRQRERELAEAVERADEHEPTDGDAEGAEQAPDRRRETDELGTLDDALAAHDYPTTAGELVAAHGDRVVESRGGWRSVADVLGPGDETFDSADEVRSRVQEGLDRA